MNELIQTQNNESGDIIVSGRELHDFLGATERYKNWFERMIGYGFVDCEDFTSVKDFTLVNNGAKREVADHHLKLNMAKEISMIQ